MSQALTSPTFASRVSRNYMHLVWDIAWFGLGFNAIGRFLSVFALRLGADEAVLGWITSLPALVMMISATFTLMWSERRSSSVAALMTPTFIYRLVFLLPAFAPLLPESWQLPWLILSVALPGIGQGISAVMFVVMVQEAVPDERLTALFSQRSLVFNMTLALSALGYGLWLEWAPFPYNYQGMYIIAFVFVMLSQWHCSRVHPILVQDIGRAEGRANPWKSRQFRAVLIVLFITFMTFNAVNALVPARLVSEMGAGEGYMAAFSLVELFAGAAASFAAPMLVRRLGNYRMIVAAMVATSLGVVLLGTSNSLALGLVSAAIAGAGWMLVAMIGTINLYTSAVPVHQAVHYSIAYHQVTGIVTFVAPFIGTALVSADLSLSSIMIIGAGLRVAAAIAVSALWLQQTRTSKAASMPASLGTVLRRFSRPKRSLQAGWERAGGSAAPTPRSPKA